MDNEKIDEIIYGPAWVDDSGEPTLRGTCCRLLYYAHNRTNVEELNRIWEHPELGRLKSAFEEQARPRLEDAGLQRYWGEEWRRYALRGRAERHLALQWEALAKVPSLALRHYGVAYHCLKEAITAVREEQAITMHILGRQIFEVATALLFARLHLEHTHVIAVWLVVDHEQRLSRDVRQWIEEGVAPERAQTSDLLDVTEDDIAIVATRAGMQQYYANSAERIDPSLPTFGEYFQEVLKPGAPTWLIDSFKDLRKRCERIDREESAQFEAIRRWHSLVRGGFSSFFSAIWHLLSGVVHGVHGPAVWEELEHGQKEIRAAFSKKGVHYSALLYFSAACFVVTESCFRELFKIEENAGFREAFLDLRKFDPRTGGRRDP